MTFRILDSLPGAGKTEYFVKTVFSDSTETLVYAAPSLELLQETANRVQGTTRNSYLLSHREVKVNGNMVNLTEGGVAKNLADLLGISESPNLAKQGSVILTTHEALMTLPDGKLAHRAHLFFDEARKCLTAEVQVSLDEDMVGAFIKTFGVVKERQVEGSDYTICQVTTTPSKKLMDALFVKFKSRGVVFADLKVTLDKYTGAAKKGRFDVKLLLPRRIKQVVRLFVFLRPDRLFQGFEKVTFLAAHFKDSQMYHLLKQSGFEFALVEDEMSESVRKRSEALKQALASRLKVIPLCANLPRATLTNNALAKELAVPISFETIMNSAEFIKSKHKGMLETFKAPLLWVLIREALSVITKLNPQGLPLIVKNKRSYVWHNQMCPNNSMDMLINNYQGAGFNAHSDMARVQDYWKQFIRTKLGVGSEERIGEVLDQVVLHGLNKYKDRNAVIHLAAINPSPMVIQFYKNYIPGYDYMSDYTIDAVVQTIYRTSLRNPNDEGPVYLAVAGEETVELLSKKLGVTLVSIHKPRIRILREVKVVKKKSRMKAPNYKEINATKTNIKYWERQPDSQKKKEKLEKLGEALTKLLNF